MHKKCDSFNLAEILEKEQITTFFQPIVNLNTGTIFAYEALVRGIRTDSPEMILPRDLFEQADMETVSAEFDRLCRRKALEQFSTFQNPSCSLMFMNINTAIIESSISENPHIGAVSHQMGFVPRQIGLELIESESSSSDALIEFADYYRQAGFLIVIDDFGTEHSNIDRLIQIHPDIIKIDRSIISGIASDSYRQSILKSIKSLAEMTGALCLAEGIETIEEIRACHLLGVDLYQGYAIAFPAPDLRSLETETLAKMDEIRKKIRETSLSALRSRRRLTGDVQKLAEWLIRQIEPKTFDSLHPIFEEFIAMNSEIECIYLLDAQGVQISETVTAPFISHQSRPSLFAPARAGANHSLKPYFTCFEALAVPQYLTDVYLSLASGNLCRTFSVKLRKDSPAVFILCIDFLEEPIRAIPGS